MGYVEVAGMALPITRDSWVDGELGRKLVRVATPPSLSGGVERWVAADGGRLLVEVNVNRHLPGQAHAFVHGEGAEELAKKLQSKYGGRMFVAGQEVL